MNEQLTVKSVQRLISSSATPAALPHARSWVAGHARWLIASALLLLAVVAGAVWWGLNGVATVHYTTVTAAQDLSSER